MMLVDKETGKGYVEMEKVHHDKKEYASKGVTIGNGKIRIGLPGINKDIVLDANDIETFKQSLVK